jgi:predicted AlkP superfamily pyrophosphatase or phosphodiesterase
MSTPAPLVILNAVGLTPRLLPHAPHLHALTQQGWVRPLREVWPSVTCTAQAAMLTGQPASSHGIVANGWLYRDTGEVRFWQQANTLLQAEPVYVRLAREWAERGRTFRCAKLFWWFNQGAAVETSVTPKPYYGVDGNKIFGITGTPSGLTDQLQRELGPFPFPTFWGPTAGLACTEWIGRCAATILARGQPHDLTLVYLPHLDYDPQRYGPEGSDLPRLVRELDAACVPILDAAKRIGARVWVVSEYGHCQVTRAILPNRALRQAGLLQVRTGPFGEQLDTFTSRAFAVCDHQLAHVYVRDRADWPRVRDLLAALPGVARVLVGDERAEIDLVHPRSGELIALAEPNAWFAYPFWLDDRHAPDYARTVAIHHKPGYDPCELFFDPTIFLPKVRAAVRLMQKKLGFRTRFDVIPLDPSLVRGSHGIPARDAAAGPLLLADGPAPESASLAMTEVADRILAACSLPGG